MIRAVNPFESTKPCSMLVSRPGTKSSLIEGKLDGWLEGNAEGETELVGVKDGRCDNAVGKDDGPPVDVLRGSKDAITESSSSSMELEGTSTPSWNVGKKNEVVEPSCRISESEEPEEISVSSFEEGEEPTVTLLLFRVDVEWFDDEDLLLKMDTGTTTTNNNTRANATTKIPMITFSWPFTILLMREGSFLFMMEDCVRSVVCCWVVVIMLRQFDVWIDNLWCLLFLLRCSDPFVPNWLSLPISFLWFRERVASYYEIMQRQIERFP